MIPVGVERLGVALEPHETYEVNPGGGGVEDARVVYIPLIHRYVMTYTAFVPYEPRVAIAVSEDLQTWQRLGTVRYAVEDSDRNLNECGNKDAAFFSEVILDPDGVPSLGILHRPTTRIHFRRNHDGTAVKTPPCGEETQENIWISYVPLDAVLADIRGLTNVRKHERILGPEHAWEEKKVGTGAPPLRLPYGWLLLYHAVAKSQGHLRYCMGAALLDLERPSKILYRSTFPILEPETDYERNGLVSNVVFPSAADLHPDGNIDVYYDVADHAIAVARMSIVYRDSA